ncbi:pyrroloquinoline quinone biosynthesis peptide chaperone PqqD [Actinomadura rubrisoli]|uniref:Pyrroloquinoline quinone biosynthesis peptide chaperone PqqD n=1 Tax=Actinomadura rubrisoli TaxID=2530368 RepID=A0A4R5B6Y9_9ACTN|nr:pyrroloquinoline quinone biosynthesis peptide chaperone PqqD [Actinomadura rubrisoli]TDD80410.1 pyrroloquinoline quinone biosynthesis peptide chaperone PqqD [Actinomadura rubrisoli]
MSDEWPESWRPALVRSVMLRYDRVRDADLLLMPERAVRLSGEGGRILRLCDGSRTVADIIAELCESFPDAPLADEVPRFLERIRAEGWLR